MRFDIMKTTMDSIPFIALATAVAAFSAGSGAGDINKSGIFLMAVVLAVGTAGSCLQAMLAWRTMAYNVNALWESIAVTSSVGLTVPVLSDGRSIGQAAIEAFASFLA